MKERTKKVVLAIELAVLVLLSAFVVSLFPNKTSVTIQNQIPVASITAGITRGEAPLEVSFTSLGVDYDGTIDLYLWDFGDGSISNLKNPKHLFEKEGEYMVCLSVKDNYGVEAKDYITINVEEEPLWVMASASYDFPDSLAPLWVQFSCGHLGGGSGEIVSYYWEFYDGGIFKRESDEWIVSRVYFAPGWKSARITVTDSEGNTATDTVMFEVTGYTERLWDIISSFFDLLPKRS